MKNPWKLWNCIEIYPERILNQEKFDKEVKFVENLRNGIDYYIYIYKNITLNKTNKVNSHIMYASKKVENIDVYQDFNVINAVSNMADIDVDVPVSFRDHVINYFRDRYGIDCVANIITFGRLDGRGAVKEVFRVLDTDGTSYAVANKITEKMVDTAKVQDKLEDLKEDNPDYTVINYCIDNIPYIRQAYDQYKEKFDIAIKMSSTITKQSKHAAGIVIANKPLAELFPLTKDPKTEENVIAVEMEDAEYCGAVKYDILGVAAYEKIDKIIEMIENNLLEPTVGIDEGFIENE